MAARILGIHTATPKSLRASSEEIFAKLKEAGMGIATKTRSYDGRVLEPFEITVFLGVIST